MRVSVVVPTYGRPGRIAACVAALQAQEAAGLEIVIVDDGSPEPVGDLPGGPHPLRLIRQENAGPAAARNRGVEAAAGELICLTDDDCTPHPGWAAAFARAAAAAPGPTLLGGATRNAARGSIWSQTSQDMADHLSRSGGAEPFFASNNIALPRRDWLALGGFDTGYRRAAGEDRAFCRAWAAAGHGFAHVPDAVLDHHHDLTLATFWRQHRNYGHGAHRFHRAARGDDATSQKRGGTPASFYLGLVGAPLRDGFRPAALARTGLVGLAQVATTIGYLEARREAARASGGEGQTS